MCRAPRRKNFHLPWLLFSGLETLTRLVMNSSPPAYKMKSQAAYEANYIVSKRKWDFFSPIKIPKPKAMSHSGSLCICVIYVPCYTVHCNKIVFFFCLFISSFRSFKVLSYVLFCNFTKFCTNIPISPLFIAPSFNKYLLRVLPIQDEVLPGSTPWMEKNLISSVRLFFSVCSGKCREEKLPSDFSNQNEVHQDSCLIGQKVWKEPSFSLDLMLIVML